MTENPSIVGALLKHFDTWYLHTFGEKEFKIDMHRVNEQDRRDRRRTLYDDASYKRKVGLRMRRGYTSKQLLPLPEKRIVFAPGFDWQRHKRESQQHYEEKIAALLTPKPPLHIIRKEAKAGER